MQGVEQLRASLLRSDSDELFDTSGVERLEVVVEQFVTEPRWIQTKVAGSFGVSFLSFGFKLDRRIVRSCLVCRRSWEGREVLLDPGRLAVYERFRTRSNLLGYAQSLEEWYTVGVQVFPQDRERLEAVLRAALASGHHDAVLGDDAVQWIELFLDRSEALYPKGLGIQTVGSAWLAQPTVTSGTTSKHP